MTYLNVAGMIAVAVIGVLMAVTGNTNFIFLGLVASMAYLWPLGERKPKAVRVGGLCALQVLISGFVYASWKDNGDTYLWIGIPVLVANIVAIVIAARRVEPMLPPNAKI